MGNLPTELVAKRDAIHRRALAQEIKEYLAYLTAQEASTGYMGEGARPFVATLYAIAENVEALNQVRKPAPAGDGMQDAEPVAVVRTGTDNSWLGVGG